MRHLQRVLLNTSAIELWPADLLRARGNADARVLAQATGYCDANAMGAIWLHIFRRV